mmetsp:Transcript_118344/g.330066  ORF Transcript_118344/g.330066 Transcript_118344/m.330066 type:complete len:166 (-) Transcript_118344:62-559(-)
MAGTMPNGLPAMGARHATLFNDVHSALHNITQDLAHFRQMAQENDRARSDEIEALRSRLEQERLEHREQINRFRYEFDDLVHGQIERLIDLIEVIHRNEKKDDKQQKQLIAQLQQEMRKIKDHIILITGRWNGLARRIEDERQPALLATAALDVSTAAVPEDQAS